MLRWPEPTLPSLTPLIAQDTESRELVAAYAPKKLTLDPVHIYTTMESELATALYEGLASYHPLSLQPVPGLAAGWGASDLGGSDLAAGPDDCSAALDSAAGSAGADSAGFFGAAPPDP